MFTEKSFLGSLTTFLFSLEWHEASNGDIKREEAEFPATFPATNGEGERHTSNKQSKKATENSSKVSVSFVSVLLLLLLMLLHYYDNSYPFPI